MDGRLDVWIMLGLTIFKVSWGWWVPMVMERSFKAKKFIINKTRTTPTTTAAAAASGRCLFLKAF